MSRGKEFRRGKALRILLRDMIVKKRWKDITRISEKLWSELQPLKGFWKDAYLASAILHSNVVVPCVVFVEKDTNDQQRLLPVHGFIRWKYNFDEETMIDATSVMQANPSPYVPSPEILGMLEEHGHFDDPIEHAKLRLKDGREYWFRKGWPGFFIGVPDGYTSSDIVGVTEWATQPFFKIDKEIADRVVGPPPYRLCIFRRPKVSRRSL